MEPQRAKLAAAATGATVTALTSEYIRDACSELDEKNAHGIQK